MNLSVQGRIFLVALKAWVLISPSLAGDLYSMYLQWRHVLGWNEGSEYVDGRGQKKNTSGLVLNLSYDCEMFQPKNYVTQQIYLYYSL